MPHPRPPEMVAACVPAGRFPGQVVLRATAGENAGPYGTATADTGVGRYRKTRVVRTCHK